jgi:hypothetical protein
MFPLEDVEVLNDLQEYNGNENVTAQKKARSFHTCKN